MTQRPQGARLRDRAGGERASFQCWSQPAKRTNQATFVAPKHRTPAGARGNDELLAKQTFSAINSARDGTTSVSRPPATCRSPKRSKKRKVGCERKGGWRR
jgi:hypothetical protein